MPQYPRSRGDWTQSMSLLPAPGAQGPVQADDPLDALSTLLSGSSPTAAAPSLSSPNRNQALSSAIAGKYGIPGAADGSVSQTDLEAMDSFMRGGALNDKIAAEVAPENVKGQYGLQNEELKGQAARDVMHTKGEYDLGVQSLKNQGLEAVAGAKAHASAGAIDPSTIDYLATQAGRDASTLTKIPMAMRSAVLERMAQQGIDVNSLTNQTRQMSETANDLLPMIDRVRQQADELKQQGLFDLVSSPMRQFLVKHGAGTMLGYGNDAAEKVGRFQTDLGLLQSGVARAHAGARGAGNSEIAARFEQLMNAGGDMPTFLGNLQGVTDLLSKYAQHTNPNAGAADDAYANPDYQPR